MRFSFTAGIKHTPALVQSVSHYLLLGLCFHTLVSAQSQPSLRPWSQTPVSDPGLRPGSQTPVSDLGLRPRSQTWVSDPGLRFWSQTPVSDPGLRFWSQSQPCPACFTALSQTTACIHEYVQCIAFSVPNFFASVPNATL